MDCIVWARDLEHTPDDELPPPIPGTSLQPDNINEEKMERIRAIQLDESESEQKGSMQAELKTAIDDSDVEGDSEVSGTDSTCLDQLEKGLETIALLREQQPCHSLKQRQLCLLGAEVKRGINKEVARKSVHDYVCWMKPRNAGSLWE